MLFPCGRGLEKRQSGAASQKKAAEKSTMAAQHPFINPAHRISGVGQFVRQHLGGNTQLEGCSFRRTPFQLELGAEVIGELLADGEAQPRPTGLSRTAWSEKMFLHV